MFSSEVQSGQLTPGQGGQGGRSRGTVRSSSLAARSSDDHLLLAGLLQGPAGALLSGRLSPLEGGGAVISR